MKKWILLIIAMVALTGCSGMTTDNGMPISSDAISKAVSYAAGKGLGYGINRIAPDADEKLGESWNNFMDRNASIQMVSPEEIISLYSELSMVLSSHVNDPLGLLGDLSALLMIFNAEFTGEGKLINIDEVPIVYLRLFELGYIGGKRISDNK